MKTYFVKSGDSISKIARDHLGDINLWPALAAANGISSPYIIMPGQELSLEVGSAEEKSPEAKPSTVEGKRKLLILAVIITAIIIAVTVAIKMKKKK